MEEWGNREVIFQAGKGGLTAKIVQIGHQGFGTRPMVVVMVIGKGREQSKGMEQLTRA